MPAPEQRLAQVQPSTPVDVEAPVPLKGLRRIAAALHHRDFRVLWIGACLSSIGTWMQSLAENWLVLSLTASAFFLGVTSENSRNGATFANLIHS